MTPDDIPSEAAGDAAASANSSSPKTDKLTATTSNTSTTTTPNPDTILTTSPTATATTTTTTTTTTSTTATATTTATSDDTPATDAASECAVALAAVVAAAAAATTTVPVATDTIVDGVNGVNGADSTPQPTTTTTTATTTAPSDPLPSTSDPAAAILAAAAAAASSSLPDFSTPTPAPAPTAPPSETTTCQPNGDDAKSSSSPSMANSRYLPPSFPLSNFASSTGSQSPPGMPVGGQLHHNHMVPSTQAQPPSSEPYRTSSGVSLPSVKSFDPLPSQHQSPPPPPPPQPPLPPLPPSQHQPQHQQHHQHHQQPQQQEHHHHQQPQQQQQPQQPQPQQPQPQQPQQQQHIPLQQPPQASTTQVAVPYSQNMHYYGSMAVPHNTLYSLPSDPAGMRYAIPPHGDPRFANTPRGQKKEIKRRTKTGCLTCRKRRIKCDEGQPTCNNCRKSKRECAGYDPVFKPQQATSDVQHHTHTLATNRPPTSAPGVPSSTLSTTPFPPSNPYGSQPAVVTGSYGTLGTSNGPTNPAITAPFVAPKPDGHQGSGPHPIPPSSTLPSATPGGYFHLRAKKMKVDNLIGLLGPSPPIRDTPLTDDLFREITRVYHEIYVYGLNAFFETTWFDVKDAKGNHTFPNNKSAIDHFATFLQAIQTTRPDDRASMLSSGILEARLIWVLAALPYTMSPPRVNNSVNGLPHPADPVEIRNRVHVFEVLLSGDHIDSNPLAPPVAHVDLHRTREFDFWRTLGDYVTFRDEPNLHRTAQREEALGRLRLLLDGRENRDLLYSIAIARELAPRYPPGYENAVPQHVDESDPKNKLFVACDFIRREAQATGGTTNVVRRFSELANQAFINPGVNVANVVSPGIVPS